MADGQNGNPVIDPNVILIRALQAQLEQQQQINRLLQQNNCQNSPQTAPFDTTKPDLWEDWVRIFKRSEYCKSSTDDVQRVDRLLVAMGVHGEAEFRKLRLCDADSQNFEVVVRELTNHFVGRKTLAYRRYLFYTRIQKPGETARQYVADVRHLADKCAFNDMADPVSELVCSQLIVGIADQQLRENLLADPKITLERVLSKIEAREQSHLENLSIVAATKGSTVSNASSAIPVEHVISTSRRTGNNNFTKRGNDRRLNNNNNNTKSNVTPMSSSQRCFNCGAPNYSSEHRSSCPARSVRCNQCGNVGHFAKHCRKGNFNKTKVNCVARESELFSSDDQDPNEVDSVFHIDSVRNKTSPSPIPFVGRIRFNGNIIYAKFDSGAEVSVIPPHAVPQGIRIHKTTQKLCGAGQSPLNVLGRVSIPLANNTKTINETFYIVNQQQQILIGAPALHHLGILRVDSWARIQSVTPVLEESNIIPLFPKLFEQRLGTIPFTYCIEVEESAVPYAVSTARNVSLPLRDAVHRELKRMIRENVIEKVERATPWCAPMVVARKKSGDVRICTDFSRLNQYVRRPRTILPDVESSLAEIGRSRIFSKLDAASGFWQVPLHRTCRDLTTFITPMGRYRYRRLPFGITSAPEFFQNAMAKLLNGLKGTICHMDDVLVFGRDHEEHDRRLLAVLERMNQAGLVLNRPKCAFSRSEVKFLGQVISREFVRPDPDRIRAIALFPRPKTLKGVRSLLGTLNQLAKFVPKLAELSEPIRALLRKNAAIQWGAAQQQAFEQIVAQIKQTTDLIRYDISARTAVIADASNKGLGAVLMQTDDKNNWKPVSFASRTLIPAENNYAPIEKEALAATWAIEKFKNFLDGKRFELFTDHLPLVSILGRKDLCNIPIRIQRFKIRLLPYVFDIKHVPGREICTADFLSRHPLPHELKDERSSSDVEVFVQAVIDRELPISAVRLDQLRELQQTDNETKTLIRLIREEWPRYSKQVPALVQKWIPYRNELSVANGLLLWRQRVVVPVEMRAPIIKLIHDGHLGVAKCQARARQCVFWPSIGDEIEEAVSRCNLCAVHRTQRPAPLLHHDSCNNPWEKIGIDLFFIRESTYLIVVDYCSGFFELERIAHMTTAIIIQHLKRIFARWGIPSIVVSDSGSQFTGSEWSLFASEYGFECVTSSPYHHQSNGAAERAVQTAKRLISKNTDLQLALLSHRATPNASGFSPAELMIGRRLKTRLPGFERRQMRPKDFDCFRQWRSGARAKAKINYDAKHRVCEPKQFVEGERTFVTDLGEYAQVIRAAKEPRSWILLSRNNRQIRRNQQCLVKLSNEPSTGVKIRHPPELTKSIKDDFVSTETSETNCHPMLVIPEQNEERTETGESQLHFCYGKGVCKSTSMSQTNSARTVNNQDSSIIQTPESINLPPSGDTPTHDSITCSPPIETKIALANDKLVCTPRQPRRSRSPIRRSVDVSNSPRVRPRRNTRPPERYRVDAIDSVRGCGVAKPVMFNVVHRSAVVRPGRKANKVPGRVSRAPGVFHV